MKFKRKKAAKRFLEIYKNHFGYSEPFKVLVDGTFVKNALDNKVQIFDQIKNYLGANVVLLTTEWYVKVIRVSKRYEKPLWNSPIRSHLQGTFFYFLDAYFFKIFANQEPN